MLLIAVAVSPLVLVVLMTAVLRQPAYLAALAGILAVIASFVVVPAFTADGGAVRDGLIAAAIITLAAAVVVIPGLYLNEQLVARHVHQRLVAWVEQLPMSPAHKAVLIVVGLAPALESLTGFGVSLLATVPLLMAITSRGTALRQAMLGMNIMPWGTLGLATVIGSALAGQPVRTVAVGTAVVSAGVFPLFGATAAVLLAEPRHRLRASVPGLVLGALFSAVLIGLNIVGIVELAGALAGVTTTVAGMLLFAKGHSIPQPPWTALAPYGLLLGAVGVIRVLPLIGVDTSAGTLRTGAVSFAPLGSPGLALTATVLILARGSLTWPALRVTAARSYKPVLTLGGFTVMAQLMVAGGMIVTLGTALPRSSGVAIAVIAPFLGMLSGYLTGSNVGGNALMMPLQAAAGHELGAPATFAAIQNSTAGHAVFASLPIILLVLAIAGNAHEGEETGLVRFGLRVAAVVFVVTGVVSVALYVVGGR